MTAKARNLLILNMILIGLILVSLQINRPKSTLNDSESIFYLTDTVGIDKIVLGNLVLNKQPDNNWNVNDKFVAQPTMVETLIAVLQRLEVKKPVANEEFTKISEQLTQKGLSIAVFRKGELLKSYKVLGDSLNLYGLLNEKPFQLHLAGYKLNLMELFESPEQSWKDRRVLFTTYHTFKSLSVSYPLEPDKNFKAFADGQNFAVEGISELDTAVLFTYLSQFEVFAVSKFATDETEIFEQLKKSPVFCLMELEDFVNGKTTLSLYTTDKGIYGIVGKTNELVMIGRRELGRMLAKKSDFQKKKEQQ